MKYFCIANPIALIKLVYTPGIFSNLPIFGTPLFGRLRVTQSDLEKAFHNAKFVFMCKTLEEAKALRLANIPSNHNMKEEFKKAAIKEGCPLKDYAIYEIEIDLEFGFSRLRDCSPADLKEMVTNDIYMDVSCRKDLKRIPNIEICKVQKSLLEPIKSIKCHYYELTCELTSEEKAKPAAPKVTS